jgi:flagellin
MVTQGALYKTNRALNISLERLSTGLRINHASDDAAGLGVSETLRTQVRGVAQAQKNAQDGIAALQIADGAANEMSDMLQRMRELAIQSSNDTLSSTDRGYVNQEFNALTNEINRIATVTNYNGMNLLSGAGATRFGNTDSVLWVDANSTTGTDSITITIDTLSTSGTQGTGLNITNAKVDSQTAATAAIATIDYALNSVNSARANIGAFVNRLEHTINNLLVSETNQQSAESAIRDVDFATETSQFTRNQILTQSATAMLAQANAIPAGVLTLISK